jgi:hypothetical protein
MAFQLNAPFFYMVSGLHVEEIAENSAGGQPHLPGWAGLGIEKNCPAVTQLVAKQQVQVKNLTY